MQQHVKDVNIDTTATQAELWSSNGGIHINRNDQAVTTRYKKISHISVPRDVSRHTAVNNQQFLKTCYAM